LASRRVGASFCAPTVRATLSLAVENGVLPPLLLPLVFTLSPGLPAVRSQARSVRPAATVPLLSGLGWK